jgi:hypothetical protein
MNLRLVLLHAYIEKLVSTLHLRNSNAFDPVALSLYDGYEFSTYTLPARPIWRISPVSCSSLRRTGQEAPSALTRLSSSFVPSILNDDFSVSISPNSGTVAVYRLGVGSLVVRSKSSSFPLKSTLAVSFLIFFKKYDAITCVGV